MTWYWLGIPVKWWIALGIGVGSFLFVIGFTIYWQIKEKKLKNQELFPRLKK